MKTISSPLIYFGNREHSQKDFFEIIEAYQQKYGRFHCFYDLFSGSGSVSLFAIANDLADHYIINDLFSPLTYFWQQVKYNPEKLITEYNKILKQFKICLSHGEQKQLTSSSAKKRKQKKKHKGFEDQTKTTFYSQLQDKFNDFSQAKRTSPEYAALFAFIINHAQNGMPLLSGQSGSLKLVCELSNQLDKLSIDIDFSEHVIQVHQVFKNKQITFSSRDFCEFGQQILEEKVGRKNLVMLDPPYPDMDDAIEEPTQHLYQRSDPKSQLQKKLEEMIKILNGKDIPFMMFYGVLGMKNPCPIYWPQGHVLHQVSSNPPYQAYVEHLYLSSNMTPFIPKHQKTIQPLFHQLVETQAQTGPFQNGERIALAWDEEEKIKELTYAELNQAANRLAHYLLQQGLEEKLHHKIVGQEPLVAIYLDRSPTLIISILAVMKTGAAFLPLAINPQEGPNTIYQFIRSSKACMLITDKTKLPSSSIADSGTYKTIIVDPIQDPCVQKLVTELKESKYQENLNRAVDPDDLLYVMYTSGSTGEPKGVEILHRGLPYAFESHQDLLNIGPDDRIAQYSSIGIDASIMEIMMALGVGAQLHLVNDQQYRDPRKLAEFLQKHKITIAIQTPKMLKAAGLKPEEFPLLRALFIVGDNFTKKLSDAWITPVTVHGEITLRQVINGYGLTETTICTTLDPCSKDKPLTIGQPILGLEVFLRSIEDEEKNLDWNLSNWTEFLTRQTERNNRAKEIVYHSKLATNLVNIIDEYIEEPLKGTIYAAGVCLARGYWQRQDLTRSRFKEVKIAGQKKILYQTGDVGYYLPDGNLVCTGRIDRQVKINGIRIELDEIENIIRKITDPKINDVRVIVYTPKQDEKTFSIEKRLVAYIIPEEKNLVIDQITPSRQGLQALKKINDYLQQNTRHPAMCPALNYMKLVADLPHKQNDKRSVDDLELQSWPVPCIRLPGEKQNPGRTTEECRLADWLRQLWANTLDLKVDTISYDQPFYTLGGDSLKTTQCLSHFEIYGNQHPKWEKALKKITFHDLFNGTLSDIFQKLKKTQTEKKLLKKEYGQLKARLLAGSTKSLMLEHESIYEEKIFDKRKIELFFIHSITGDAELDYSGTELATLPWYSTLLSTPNTILEFYEKKSREPLNSQSFLSSLVQQHLKKIVKKSPIWLLSWSSGGFITKLIGRELRKQGLKVYIWILDTHHPQLIQAMDKVTHARSLVGMGDRIKQCIAQRFELSSIELRLPNEQSLSSLINLQQIDYFFLEFITQFNLYVEFNKEKLLSEKILLAKKLIISAYGLYHAQMSYPLDEVPLIDADDILVVADTSAKLNKTLGWTISQEQLITIADSTHFNLLGKLELSQKIISYILKTIQTEKEPFYQMTSSLIRGDLSTFLTNMEQLKRQKINPLVFFKKNLDQAAKLKLQTDFKREKKLAFAKKVIKNFDLKNTSCLVALGKIYIEIERYENAIEYLQKAIAIDQQNDSAYYYLGLAFLETNNLTQAKRTLTQCIALKKEHLVSSYSNRAVANFRDHADSKQVLVDLDNAFLLSPNDVQVYMIRSQIKLAYNDLAGALQDSTAALKQQPTAELYHLRGHIYYELKSYDQAVKDYDKAIGYTSSGTLFLNKMDGILTVLSNPGNPIFFFDRGIVNLILEQYHSAIQDFSQVLNLTPKDLDALFCRGLAYFREKNFTKALIDFNQVIKFDSSNCGAIFLRGLAKAELDHYEQAIEDYQSYINKRPADSQGYANLGLAQAHLKKYDQALIAYNKALECNPKCIETYCNRGGTKIALADFKGAVSDLNQVIESKDQIPKHLSSIAYRLRAFCKIKLSTNYTTVNAEADCTMSIEMNPKDPDPYIVRCQIRAQTENINGAKKDFEVALGLGIDKNTQQQIIKLLKFVSVNEKKSEEQKSLSISTITDQLAINPEEPQTPRTQRLFASIKNLADIKDFTQAVAEASHAINSQNSNKIGDTPIISLLRQYKLNKKKKRSLPPKSHIAERHTAISKIEILVKAGALWNKPNKQGETAENLLSQFDKVAQAELEVFRK